VIATEKIMVIIKQIPGYPFKIWMGTWTASLKTDSSTTHTHICMRKPTEMQT